MITALFRWVLHGELHDSCKEFFVGCKTASSQPGSIGNMWLDTYYMRPSMLPTFLSRALAERALVIGKSINFIRLCVHKCPKSKSMKMRVKGQVRERQRERVFIEERERDKERVSDK